MLRKLANGWRPGSPAARLRQKRFALFLQLLETLPEPVDILDIGGQEAFWKVVGVDHPRIRSIVLLNRRPQEVTLPKLSSVIGDARRLDSYPDSSVDVIFSNSTIEHVGGLRDQQMAAREIQRVGRHYFVQTPNRFFPIEPHFLFPFFQFLPQGIRAQLHHRWTLGWWKKQDDYFEALAEVESIRLLSAAELKHLFPNSHLVRESFLGLTKSLIVLGGWPLHETQLLLQDTK
jgi:Spermidine synthase